MLALGGGQAMTYIVEELGSRWAIDGPTGWSTADSGVPQRRQRVFLVASRTEDPRGVLFADDAGQLSHRRFRERRLRLRPDRGIYGARLGAGRGSPIRRVERTAFLRLQRYGYRQTRSDVGLCSRSSETASRSQGFPNVGWTIRPGNHPEFPRLETRGQRRHCRYGQVARNPSRLTRALCAGERRSSRRHEMASRGMGRPHRSSRCRGFDVAEGNKVSPSDITARSKQPCSAQRTSDARVLERGRKVTAAIR